MGGRIEAVFSWCGLVAVIGCAFIFDGNTRFPGPWAAVPVVAAVVEHEGDLILARNKAWSTPFYALITGFLEKTDPSPEEAVAREVKEELGLEALSVHFIGHYRFERQNQLILAYHVPAAGIITLGDELADYKRIDPARAKYWPVATGLALRDWLVSKGHQPESFEVPRP